MTFLLVASSTSKAGTIAPAGSVSILRRPADILSTRSANILKLSKSVRDAGQLACILRVMGCWAVAGGGASEPPSMLTAASRATAGPKPRHVRVVIGAPPWGVEVEWGPSG